MPRRSRYLDELTRLLEHLTKIADGRFCQMGPTMGFGWLVASKARQKLSKRTDYSPRFGLSLTERKPGGRPRKQLQTASTPISDDSRSYT
jgi:hypothetical protein